MPRRKRTRSSSPSLTPTPPSISSSSSSLVSKRRRSKAVIDHDLVIDLDAIDADVKVEPSAAEGIAPRAHIEDIRRKKFSIGGVRNPLTDDLHQAVKNLSAELYSKDVHFLMELIQNAEDNEYMEGVDPTLEFVITSRDITGTGAPSTLLVFNNEIGFSPKNIDSICSVGLSTKKGLRKQGYIGEKGIGFKSVFLITAQPYIFSNGYQIRFSEKPCSHCNVGYVVPEWVEENPTVSAIQSVYGSAAALPTTIFVLPLKRDKVQSVKDQLSQVHPEVLLFLSKIKRLSVREDTKDHTLGTMSAISISKTKDMVTRKSIDAESYNLHLTAHGISDKEDSECGYHVWRQRFPVNERSRVEIRKDVEEWVISLAFPLGNRLKRGDNILHGIYAFLPVPSKTDLPFIIQADFLLSSSREKILWHNKWNKGILDCVPLAFVNAFVSLVKSTEGDLLQVFRFLPLKESCYPSLNSVRESVKTKMTSEAVIPCESHTVQKLFRKPCEVGHLMSAFWSVLKKAREQGVSLYNISSHGTYILSSWFDNYEMLEFLGIKFVDYEWYAKCIRGSNLLMGVSDDVYLELLLFLAKHWSFFKVTDMKNIPLIKYVGVDGKESLFCINEVSQEHGPVVLLSQESRYISWLIDWNREFKCPAGRFFVPKLTQEAIESCSILAKETLKTWLRDEVKVRFVCVFEYAKLVCESLNKEPSRKLAVAFVHFLYRSLQKGYLTKKNVKHLCGSMPLVDSNGQVTTQSKGVLVPANGSRWWELINSNLWCQEDYIELGEDYLHSVSYAGIISPDKELIDFLQDYVSASDVPDVYPPDAAIPTLSGPLTKANTFLLLTWIRNLRTKKSLSSQSGKFLSSIKEGSWLKIISNGSPGHKPPSQSFMLDSSSGLLLQNGSALVDIPLIDQEFYGDEINDYRDELRAVGVMFDHKEACMYIGRSIMRLVASSTLTKANVLSILNFVKILSENYLSHAEFTNVIKTGGWLRTSKGVIAPKYSVLFSQEWSAASQISDIPFIDHKYYGEEFLAFKAELGLLGVKVAFGENYQLVVDYLKPSSLLVALSAEALYLALRCIQNLKSPGQLIKALEESCCLKTNFGYKRPAECLLFNPKSNWGCLLQVFSSLPVIDEKFYGEDIFSFEKELDQINVLVDFKKAGKLFADTFKEQALSSVMSKESALSLFACYRKFKTEKIKIPESLNICIRRQKWLRTRLGKYMSPNECIWYDEDWESVSPISALPFIDVNFYGDAIYDYYKELQQMGVVMDIERGSDFVVSGLQFPQDSSSITPANVYALLKCIRRFQESKRGKKSKTYPVGFDQKIAQSWLKTSSGYRPPSKCLLFDSDWEPFLKINDGPFIDEEFYGSDIKSYKEELRSLGVVVDVKDGCLLMATNLKLQSNFSTMSRIYNYLYEFKWEPVDVDSKKIWIPMGNNKGKWVIPQDCVLHDKRNLFAKRLHALEKLDYKKKLLDFFANMFQVKLYPSVDDYCKLWKEWEGSGIPISHGQCCAFWEFAVENWDSKTEEAFCKNLLKLPVFNPTTDEIFLFDKRDVFIADDLFVMGLFESCYSHPLSVWYPQPSIESLPRAKLLEIYWKIGIRALSESVQKDISTVSVVGLKPVPRELFIKRGLITIILAFLSGLPIKTEADTRHEAVGSLGKVTVFETVEPIEVGYSLLLSSGEMIKVKECRTVRWEKQKSALFIQKIDKCGRLDKRLIEHASHFGEVIAEGVLPENKDLMKKLAEVIRLGFLGEFDKEVVEFLMKTNNLQIFREDKEYLSSTFPSD